MKKRLLEFLTYLDMGQTRFEEKTGVSRGAISKMSVDGMNAINLIRIATAYPELNVEWLLLERGEMLKQGTNVTHGKNSPIMTGSASGGVVAGAVSGTVNVNHNSGKDMVIDEQKKEVEKMFDAIMSALIGFQKASERHDGYIVDQDEYIKDQAKRLDRIVDNAYQRNERNMERMDTQFAQQNKLIEMVVEQNNRTQDRADKLLDMLKETLTESLLAKCGLDEK